MELLLSVGNENTNGLGQKGNLKISMQESQMKNPMESQPLGKKTPSMTTPPSITQARFPAKLTFKRV